MICDENDEDCIKYELVYRAVSYRGADCDEETEDCTVEEDSELFGADDGDNDRDFDGYPDNDDLDSDFDVE